MELTETIPMVGAGFVASDQELAAMEELMEPSELLVADPPLYNPPTSLLAFFAISPPEPVDDPDNE